MLDKSMSSHVRWPPNIQDPDILLRNFQALIGLTYQSCTIFLKEIPCPYKVAFMNEMDSHLRQTMNMLEYMRISFDKGIHITNERRNFTLQMMNQYCYEKTWQEQPQATQYPGVPSETDPSNSRIAYLEETIAQMKSLMSEMASHIESSKETSYHIPSKPPSDYPSPHEIPLPPPRNKEKASTVGVLSNSGNCQDAVDRNTRQGMGYTRNLIPKETAVKSTVAVRLPPQSKTFEERSEDFSRRNRSEFPPEPQCLKVKPNAGSALTSPSPVPPTSDPKTVCAKPADSPDSSDRRIPVLAAPKLKLARPIIPVSNVAKLSGSSKEPSPLPTKETDGPPPPPKMNDKVVPILSSNTAIKAVESPSKSLRGRLSNPEESPKSSGDDKTIPLTSRNGLNSPVAPSATPTLEGQLTSENSEESPFEEESEYRSGKKKLVSTKGRLPDSIEEFRIPPCWDYSVVVLSSISAKNPSFQLLEDEYRIPSFDSEKDLEPLVDVCVGDLVLAQFEMDKVFYRAKVTGLENGQYQVLFIDYGNTAYLTLKDLRKLPDHCRSMCQLALECCLDESLHPIKKKILGKLEGDSVLTDLLYMISLSGDYRVRKDGRPVYEIMDIQQKGSLPLIEMPEAKKPSVGSLTSTIILKNSGNGLITVRSLESKGILERIGKLLAFLPTKSCLSEHAVVGSYVVYESFRARIRKVSRSASGSLEVCLELLDYAEIISKVPIEECSLAPIGTLMYPPMKPIEVRLAEWDKDKSVWDDEKVKDLISTETEVEMDILSEDKNGLLHVDFFDCEKDCECVLIKQGDSPI